MQEGIISNEHLIMIITSTIVGMIARILTIKEDYRQNPSYPNGYLLHILIGFVAAALGAVAIPALMTGNFVAVTFLVLAVQQFRDVRKTERDSLLDLELTENTKRGHAYIDGIAKTFESRNYFALTISFVTSVILHIFDIKPLWFEGVVGGLIGLILFYPLKRMSKGKTVGDIAYVKPGKIETKGSELYVDKVFISNLIGVGKNAERFQTEGLAAVIYPKKDQFFIPLSNFGQRQAILFDIVRSLGSKRYQFTHKDYERGCVIIALVPIKQDQNKMIEIINSTPVLESIQKSESVLETNLIGKK